MPDPALPVTGYSNAKFLLKIHLDNLAVRLRDWYGLPVTIRNGEAGAEIVGTGASEHILGSQGGNVIRALGGDDYIQAGLGRDTLYGGEGHDFIDSGRGDDIVYGGPGDDFYLFYPISEGGDDQLIELAGEGFDWVRSSAVDFTLGDNFEGLFLIDDGDGGIGRNGIGNALDNIMVGQGVSGFLNLPGIGRANWFQGLGGNDYLLGMGGDDRLEGGIGDDWLEGGDDKDQLIGGVGADVLFGNNGNDTIDGGEGSDWIEGGNGDDIVIASQGADVALGGAGRDYFDYRQFSFATGGVHRLYGGTDTASLTQGPVQSIDIVQLPGRVTDYDIVVNWARGTTPLSTTVTHHLSGMRLVMEDVERADFATPFDNVVRDSQGATLTAAELIFEAALMSSRVYGPQPTLEHRAEILASEEGAIAAHTTGVAGSAELKGWHALSALELGIAAAGTTGDGFTYAMVNGLYQANGTSSRIDNDVSQANALVTVGMVNGKRALSLAFRGTDQLADFGDYADFGQHYAKFAPLIAAIDAYVAENGIELVLISGHSLGGAMVQEYMATHSGSQYRAVTIGSPGSDNAGFARNDSRILNFAESTDPVPTLAPNVSQIVAPGGPALALLLRAVALTYSKVDGALNILSDLFVAEGLYAELAPLLENLQAKYRDGPTVFLNSDRDGVEGAHSRFAYLDQIQQLMTFAADTSSPFYTTELAAQLREWRTDRQLGDIQIALVSGPGSQVTSVSGDSYVLGSANSDGVFFRGSGGPIRVIDLGANPANAVDTIYLERGAWSRESGPAGSGYERLLRDGMTVAHLHNVERIVLLDTFASIPPPGATLNQGSALIGPVVYLDGRAPNVQAVAAGDSAVLIDSAVDYAVVGDGNRIVTGSTDADIIIAQKGRYTIDGGRGDDIVHGVNASSGSSYNVAGGAGDDRLVGQVGSSMTARYSGSIADYVGELDADRRLILRDIRDGTPDGVDTLIGVSALQFADVTLSHAEFIAAYVPLVIDGTDLSEQLGFFEPVGGLAQRRIIFGNGSIDSLNGGTLADFLDGGTDNDRMTGFRGDDIYVIDRPNDIVIEQAGEGDDLIIWSNVVASDSYTLPDNVERLTMTGTGNLTANGNGINNIIIGNAGANSLSGGIGDDMLDGGAGMDRLTGGVGNDSYVVDAADDLVFENVGEGTDSVSASFSHYLYAHVENLTLTGSGNIFGVGNDLANALTGNAGENLLIAGAGIDTVYGGAARDAIFGESGDDQLFGEAGIDYIVAGIGNDSVDGGLDADEIYGEAGDDILNGGASFHTDIVVGGDGNDILRGDSGLGDFDYLYGNAGNDTFYVDTPADLVFENAREGTDTVFANINGAGFYLYDNIENLTLLGTTPFGVGNALANSIRGNSGSNYLLGGAGNDVLNGMGGGDVLFGEAGSDIFAFARGTGGDVIGDFERGIDKIDLRAFGFTSFVQLQSAFVQNGDVGAIILGNGDLVVLHNVIMSQLSASDFVI